MQFRRTSILLFSTIIGIVGLLLFAGIMIDLGSSGRAFSEILELVREQGLQTALAPLPEVLAALLGIMLTVVAIVVQLAAQRYSTKVIDLFLRDSTNLSFFLFMVVSCTYVTVVPMFAPESGPTPVVTVGIGLVLCIINFTLLLPYVAYVFTFLQPSNIIRRIEADADRHLAGLVARENASHSQIEAAQAQVAMSVERISDSCLSAIQQSDRYLAVYTLEVLEQMLCSYLERESELPEAWSRIDKRHFYMLSKRHHEEIVESKVWVEAKILYEFEHAYRYALRLEDQDILARIASATHAVGVKAIEVNDRRAVKMVIRFFNTFMRHALNVGQVRTCYTVLYQYRVLASHLRESHADLLRRVCEHIVYYGRLAREKGAPFVTVTAAHDLSTLCLDAYGHDPQQANRILKQMFTIVDADDDPERANTVSIGMLQVFAILGTRLLERGDTSSVVAIQAFLRKMPAGALRRMKERTLAVTDWKFWEVTDRGDDFNYLPPSSRPHFERLLAAVHAASGDAAP